MARGGLVESRGDGRPYLVWIYSRVGSGLRTDSAQSIALAIGDWRRLDALLVAGLAVSTRFHSRRGIKKRQGCSPWPVFLRKAEAAYALAAFTFCSAEATSSTSGTTGMS